MPPKESTPLAGQPAPLRDEKIRRNFSMFNNFTVMDIRIAWIYWVIFVVTACVFSFGFSTYTWHIWILAILSTCVFFHILVFKTLGLDAKHKEHLLIIFFCVASAACAVLVGLLVTYVYTEEYHRLAKGSTYTNVSPLSRGEAYSDAAVLQFTPSSFVDQSQTFGWNHAGVTFCVAPISDVAASGPAAPIEYWAVGINCCEPRTGFACDDVQDPDAKAGVTINPSSALKPSWLKAIKKAEELYDITSDSGALMVSWSQNPDRKKSSLWSRACGVLVGMIALALLFLLGFSFIVNRLVRPAERRGLGVWERQAVP